MVSDDIDLRMNRPWPRGRAGRRRRNLGVAPLEPGEPLWFEERWLFGPIARHLRVYALPGAYVGGVIFDMSHGWWMGLGRWTLIFLAIVGLHFAVAAFPPVRRTKHLRVGPEGLVLHRWEVPGSAVRRVWALSSDAAQRVARSRTADGAPVWLANHNTRSDIDWKNVRGVLTEWHDAPLPLRTRYPGRIRDAALLVATKDPEGLAGALARFPNARRAAGLPELEVR